MAVTARRVTVGTAPTRLDSDTVWTFTRSVLVENVGAESVFVGGAGVTAADGKTVAAGGAITVDVRAADELYAVVPGPGTVDVEVLESG